MAEHTIALIFDFDDTLTPDSTTSFLKFRGVDIVKFWDNDFNKLVKNGWCPTHAVLKLILDLTRPGAKLEGLTNSQLSSFGKGIKPYPGIPQFFQRIKKVVGKFPGISVKFWIISGGLEEMILGCNKISKHIDGIWGCQLAGEIENGPIKYIKRAITFTEKTRYIFEINKGLSPLETKGDPYLVNREINEAKRPIPFRHMIYVGDGLTDIPCFSLIGKREDNRERGYPVGILDKAKDRSKRVEIIHKLLKTKRTVGTYQPNFLKGTDLSTRLEEMVLANCFAIEGDKARIY